MTSLLPSPPRAAPPPVRARRPLALLATLGGAAAAAAPLLVCLAVGVAGWFLSDAGAHGTPRDGLRAGTLAWLMAHGSGLTILGARVEVVPLGLTAVCAWSMWRLGHRTGAAVSGHGPDADRIADGERDWTVPAALLFFTVGYGLVVVVAHALAAGPETAPSVARALLWTVALVLVVAGPALAIGSGRAAIWATFVPAAVRFAGATCLSILGTFVLASGVLFLVGLSLDLGQAATMMSRLHVSAGEATLFTLVNAGFVPNAALFSGAFLLGPGFAVGAGTLVSPGAVVLGPLPMFPLLAALPTTGATSAWVAALVAVPPLTAVLATVRVQRRHPTLRWDEGGLRGCAGGILAGIAFAVLAAVAGGAAGPGRMRHVTPFAGEVLVHAITVFGLGGLVAGLATTAWQRRRARAAVDAAAPGPQP